MQTQMESYRIMCVKKIIVANLRLKFTKLYTVLLLSFNL